MDGADDVVDFKCTQTGAVAFAASVGAEVKHQDVVASLDEGGHVLEVGVHGAGKTVQKDNGVGRAFGRDPPAREGDAIHGGEVYRLEVQAEIRRRAEVFEVVPFG